MRGSTPTLHCDAEDGECSAWDVDYYGRSVSTLGGVRITSTERAPGWLSTAIEDACPQHRDALAQRLVPNIAQGDARG